MILLLWVITIIKQYVSLAATSPEYPPGRLVSALPTHSPPQEPNLGVPIDELEVDVEADVDASGNYGIDDAEPGYTGMR